MSKQTLKISKPKSLPWLVRRLPSLQSLWLKSQTKLVAATQAVAAVGLGGISEINTYVSDPHFKDYLSNFDVPKYVYIGLATLALITYLAHGRNNDV